MLEGSEKVFKLVGPVLMNVELEESRDNVAKRLEFIETEIKKLDSAIGEFYCDQICCQLTTQLSILAAKQGDQTTLGDEIAALQQKMQADTAAAVKEIADRAK